MSAFLFLIPMVPYAASLAVLPACFQAGTPLNLPLPPSPSWCPSGALARPDAGGPPSFPCGPPQPWERMETPGWKLLETPRFMVRGDAPVADLRKAADTLEREYVSLRRAMGGDPGDAPFAIRIFADARRFSVYATRLGAPGADSLYDPASGEVVTHADAAGLRESLAHELVHAYMHRVWNCTGPVWFAEGMAERFSGGPAQRLRMLEWLKDRPLPSLGGLLRKTPDDFYGASFPALYAQAWSLVDYLVSREDGLVDLLLRGGTLRDIGELERGWQSHVESLVIR